MNIRATFFLQQEPDPSMNIRATFFLQQEPDHKNYLLSSAGHRPSLPEKMVSVAYSGWMRALHEKWERNPGDEDPLISSPGIIPCRTESMSG
jgi:hypothetical protein